MRRIATMMLLGAIAVFATSAGAQTSGKIPRVGIVQPGDENSTPYLTYFKDRMRALGYVDGQNVVYDIHYYGYDLALAKKLNDELVRSRVDVIFAASTLQVRTAQAATHDIPIVFAAVADPLGEGFIASLARPSGNITGMSQAYVDWAPKSVQHLIDAMPGIRRVALLRNSEKTSDTWTGLVSIKSGLARLKIDHAVFDARAPTDFSGVMASIKNFSPDAVLLIDDTLFYFGRDALIAESMAHKLPLFCGLPGMTGCLVNYAPDIGENFRGAAAYVDKILKGTKPSELPVIEPTKFVLSVNLVAAKTLGLTLPQAFVLQADEMIE